MKHRYLPAALGGLALLLTLHAAQAQDPARLLLRDAAPSASPLAAALRHARPLTLDVAEARARLAAAPPEDRAATAPLQLSLPLPDGRTQRFAVWQTAVMAPALASRYPDIRTYAGRGLDDATATLRLDLTPAGFHAQVLSEAGTVYIEPARRGDTGHYLSFFARDVRPGEQPPLVCQDAPAPKTARRLPASAPGAPHDGSAPAAIGSGALLRTYRLAVAATAEYTAFHGGTVAQAQAAIVTSVNRINGIFEGELAVRFQLVANNDRLIFLNGNTDPYTATDTYAMLPENQATVDRIIGPGGYDIGHVFGGLNVGGRAMLRSVCVSGLKAQGNTSLSSPIGDFFSVKYTCHELGHQFGANHSFNSANPGSCGTNRNASTAFEPGSGTTIMSYSGLCGADDIQSNSDSNFHLGSLEEMQSFILTTSCATTLVTGNSVPVVTVPASGKTIPISTPFKLTANAGDRDNNVLRYSWEQVDLGPGSSPYGPQVANATVPLFRAWVPTTSPTRYFPRLNELVLNSTPGGERLPTVARRLTFQVAVRDLHNGPGGTVGGLTTSDSVKLQVSSAAGPFLVTAPNTPLTWAGGSTQTVTWSVAGTNVAPVSCATVNLRLSTDGGLTYPTLLAAGVPNNGSAPVTLPAVATTTARLMVEAADNYFFDISNANFTISTPSVCAPPSGLSVTNISSSSAILSFNGSSGATQYVVTTLPATTTQTVSRTPVFLNGLTPGTVYTVQVTSLCGGTASVTAAQTFRTTSPDLCGVATELVVSNRTPTTATLGFLPANGAGSYTVSTSPATSTQTTVAGPVTLTGLNPATFYTVRVVASCTAGPSEGAGTVRFRTPALPPANDLCANAMPLACGVRVQASTDGATPAGDPTGTCVESVDQGGIFYSLQGTGGPITLSTCDAATDFDTKLFVYTGSCGGYTCLAGNDDTRNGTCDRASTLTFNSTPGTRYLVMVSGWDTEFGTFGLLATCGPVATRAALAAQAFQVWPTPTDGAPALHLALPAPAATATATLHSVLGQRLREHRFSGGTTELPTAGLAPGTYLLTVRVAGQAPAVQRVVVR